MLYKKIFSKNFTPRNFKNLFPIISCVVILFFYSANATAQNNYFKIAGQYRVRPEFRKGYKTLSTDTSKAAFFVTQRARLTFEYKKDNITTYTSIQDIRTWGDEEQSKDIAGLAVNELWMELAFKKGFSLKMGRQELVYDDQRLLGNADWSNATRSHDGLLLKYANKEKKFYWHTGAAFNQSGEPLFGTAYNLKNYKYLGFTWIKKGFSNPGNSISATAIVNGLNSTVLLSPKSKASLTLGPLFNFQKNIFKGLLGAYYQTGKTENNLLLSAFMFNAYAGIRKKIIAGIGLDYLSGNSDNTSATHSHSFSTLYATNHKFYGFMDYFTNIPADTKQRGLVDAYVRLGVPGKKVTTTVDAHYFSLPHKNNFSTNNTTGLGTETDLLVDYQPSTVIDLQFGYSMMFANKNMELIKGGNKNNYQGWAFVMLKVSPTFFLHEIKN
ncbi:MAG TPA: alginate export family protein [Chitinophagaceae bacterium]